MSHERSVVSRHHPWATGRLTPSPSAVNVQADWRLKSPSRDTVPAVADAVLRTPGRPLDVATRELMEWSLGHDFSRVRVHTDAQAAASASALHARAYTVGSSVVFQTGQYAPSTPEGRRLLAHELAHVMQQQASSVHEVQRDPDDTKTSGQSLGPPGPGKFSPKEYEVWLKKHPKRVYQIGGPWQPDFLAKRYTPKWFADHGYYYAGRGGVVPHNWFEVWLNDQGDGAEYRVWHVALTSAEPASKAETGQSQKEPLSPGEQITSKFPDHIDPNADHEKLFGPVIAERLDVDSVFGEGDMLLHNDGTVVLHLTGRNKSIVLRPGPNGLYIVYWEDGRRDRMPYQVPASEIPDRVKDAID
jgi:hypothetical protein